jgi:hypothetical protein
MNRKDTQMNSDTQPDATTFGAASAPEINEVTQTETQEKISNSHLKLRALSTLRNATTPRDPNLDKTKDLPRDERLGKPLPPDVNSTASISQTSQIALDATRLQPHPWHRLFARWLDGFVLSFIIAVPPFFVRIAYGILGVEHGAEIGVALTMVLSFMAAILYEPMMISMFGTTLGKAMLGIKLRDQLTGEYLSFGRAWARMWWVAWYSGNILSIIPLVGIFAPIVGHLMQYQKLTRDKITSYDDRLKVRYLHG